MLDDLDPGLEEAVAVIAPYRVSVVTVQAVTRAHPDEAVVVLTDAGGDVARQEVVGIVQLS